jgi:hypothetical protein
MFYCLHLAPIVNRLWTHITPLYRPRYEYRAQLLSPGDRDAEGAVAERVSAAVCVSADARNNHRQYECVSAPLSLNQNSGKAQKTLAPETE